MLRWRERERFKDVLKCTRSSSSSDTYNQAVNQGWAKWQMWLVAELHFPPAPAHVAPGQPPWRPWEVKLDLRNLYETVHLQDSTWSLLTR
ncbi:hypothetical protein Y1Q_0002228 [Alligator mississippiensis]|uniref:Uncharacterized protein n=1 Tax=Alligator mississippiensis TaxID=8496 RepID=A0A151MGC5_ALLMI|nr:hypothetical protein Y1Q_0002228 [Alligator mississippiensis]